MKKREIKELLQSVIDDPAYINTATEILWLEKRQMNLPDLRQFLLDHNVGCMIRLDQNCEGFGDQRAHVRMNQITGTGLKAPDPLFAWSCSYCHRATESNPKTRLEHAEGVMRTLYILIKGLPMVAKNDVTRQKTNKGMG